jgi:hypothetical protein
MVSIKVLKRMDASSVTIAIVLGFILWGAVSSIGGLLTALVTGNGDGVEFVDFVRPLVAVIFELLLLEIGVRVAVILREGYIKGK